NRLDGDGYSQSGRRCATKDNAAAQLLAVRHVEPDRRTASIDICPANQRNACGHYETAAINGESGSSNGFPFCVPLPMHHLVPHDSRFHCQEDGSRGANHCKAYPPYVSKQSSRYVLLGYIAGITKICDRPLLAFNRLAAVSRLPQMILDFSTHAARQCDIEPKLARQRIQIVSDGAGLSHRLPLQTNR